MFNALQANDSVQKKKKKKKPEEKERKEERKKKGNRWKTVETQEEHKPRKR